MPKTLSLPDFDTVLADSDLPDFDETLASADLASADADASKALKTAPKSLPALPKPRVPGLNPEDLGPLDVAAPWGKPDSFLGKATKPIADAANWMSEGMVSGPVRALEGFKAAASRDPQLPVDRRLQGMADMLEGGMEAARPLAGPMVRSLPGLLKNAPKLTSAELAVGMGGPPIVREALTSLGASEGASNLAAAVTGAVPLGGLAKKSLTPEPKSVYTKAASEVPPPGTSTETPSLGAPQVPPRSQPTAEIVESSTLTPTPEVLPPVSPVSPVSSEAPKLNSRQRRMEKRIAKRIEKKTQAEKAQIKVRPVSEVLSDESGQLDIDKLFDVVTGAKERLFAKDPLTKRSEELKNAGNIATGKHKAYSDFLRETHPAWLLQELVKGGDITSSPRVGEGLEKFGIPQEKQPAALLESMSGTMDKIDMDLEQLRDLLYPYRDVFKDPEAKMYGIRERHAEREAKPRLDDEGNVLPYKLPGGETFADNAKAMRDFEAKQGPQGMKRVHEAWKRYRLMQNLLFTRAMDAGLMSKDFYDNSQADNEKFVPFWRLDFVARELNNDNVIPVGRKAFAVGEKEFQNFMQGSEREILDPMMSAVRNIIRTERAIASNKARQALAGLKDLPAGKDWVIEMDSNGRPRPIVDATGKRVIPGIPMGFQPVSYLVDGKKHQVLVPKDVAELYSHMDQETSNMVTNMMGYFSNFLRTGVTTYPEFWTSNMARDYYTALQTEGLDPIAWAKGLVASTTRNIPHDKVANYLEKLGVTKGLYKKFADKTGFGSKTYDEYRKSGAGHSGAYSYGALPKTADDILRSKTEAALRKVWDPGSRDFVNNIPGGPLLEWSGQTAELVPRLAVFEKSKKAGKTPFESGFASRNATINFALGGKALREYYHIQAFLKGRTGASRTGVESAMKHPGLTAMRLGIGLGLPAAYLYHNNVMKYPEVWDSLDEDIKRNHLILIQGDGKDARGRYNQIKSVRLDGIPAAFYGSVVGAFEIIRGADPGGWMRNGIQLISDMLPVGVTRKGKFSPNEIASALTPSIGATLYTMGSGKDLYTGRDLEMQPGVRRDAKPEDRYNLQAKTPMVAAAQGIKSATGIGMSPHVLEAVPKGLFGHWGRAATEMMPTVGGDDKSSTQRVVDAIKLQPFTKPLPAKREIDLAFEDKIQERGSRFQDYTREAELILKKAQTAEDYRDLSQTSLQSLIARYPDRPPAKIAEEFRDLQKRLNEAKRKNFSGFERSLYLAPAEARAELIMDALRQMPEAKRASTWKTWTEKGIISSSVRRELRLLEEKTRRQQSAPTVP